MGRCGVWYLKNHMSALENYKVGGIMANLTKSLQRLVSCRTLELFRRLVLSPMHPL